jgi:hypothetical protein
MSAASDAATIGGISNQLHNALNAATPDIQQCRQLHAGLCAKLTRGITLYGPTLGLTPSEIETAIQGGGTGQKAV